MGLKNTGRQCTIDSFAAHDLKSNKPLKWSLSDAVLDYIAKSGKCSMSEIKKAKKMRNS